MVPEKSVSLSYPFKQYPLQNTEYTQNTEHRTQNTEHRTQNKNSEHRTQNKEHRNSVHKTTYGPLIDMAQYEMLLMRAKPILGQVVEGWALEILTFFGHKWHSPNSSMPFHRAQKFINSRALPPPICPRNVSARIGSIMYGVAQIVGPKILYSLMGIVFCSLIFFA